MKALLALKAAYHKSSLLGITALVALVPAIYPEITLANELPAKRENSALVFEINNSSKLLVTNSNTQSSVQIQDIAKSDPLCEKLKQYLEAHNSPLAEYSCDIILQPQWQRALAISWVESNFGRFCHSDNCSGIGGAPGMPTWRKYPNKLEWFKDMCQLMEKPIYKEKYTTFEKMRGVYVQPGSASWVNGAKDKYADLMILTTQAQEEKIANLNSNTIAEHVSTFPELAMK